MRRPSPEFLLVCAGLLLLVVGLVTCVTGRPASFGWFAYGVVGIGDGSGGRVILLGPRQLLGAGTAAAGALVLATALGFRLGRRHRPLRDTRP